MSRPTIRDWVRSDDCERVCGSANDIIAMNDDPGEMDVEAVSDSITVMLLAELFGVERERVARDVVRHRAKHGVQS